MVQEHVPLEPQKTKNLEKKEILITPPIREASQTAMRSNESHQKTCDPRKTILIKRRTETTSMHQATWEHLSSKRAKRDPITRERQIPDSKK